MLRKRGKLAGVDVCRKCSSPDLVELHHPNILKQPMLVVPLCRPHHYEIHGRRISVA